MSIVKKILTEALTEDVYNDFMKILGDKRDSKSIRLAVEQYVIEAYTK